MTSAAPEKHAASPDAELAGDDAAFDDVMLAMDIVDTLRHRAAMVARELDGDARETALIERLKEIYAAQGIDVPDHILKDGVTALEEKRFAYEPKTGGFWFALARAYVARDRWLKPVGALVGIAAFATAIYEFGISGPLERTAKAETTAVTQTLPPALAEARDAGLARAQTDYARQRIEAAYQEGRAALDARNIKDAENAVADLRAFERDLAAELSIRIVSRPDEFSGVYRIPNDAPNTRNYYLIVEAITASGQTHALEMESEEDRARRRTERWGVRVPKGVFDKVAADKKDDQIIQDDTVGEKPAGALLPVYTVSGAGGAILDW